jgi:hypothetical protein
MKAHSDNVGIGAAARQSTKNWVWVFVLTFVAPAGTKNVCDWHCPIKIVAGPIDVVVTSAVSV